MIREAELAEIEKEWRERNARIMAEHPDAEGLDATLPKAAAAPEASEMLPLATPAPIDAATAEAALTRADPALAPQSQEPEPVEEAKPARRTRRKGG